MPAASFAPSAASGRPRTQAHRLAEAHQRLVHTVIARRFPFLLRDPERLADAFTAGYVALVRACERFDPRRDRAFSSYACPCIEGGVLRSLKTERGQAELPTVSLETPLSDDGGTLEDLVADERADIPGRALVSEAGFERLLSLLDKPRHAAALRAVYQGDMTHTELAAAWNISRARCHQIEREALGRIREALTPAKGRKGRAATA